MEQAGENHGKKAGTAGLALAALGVVYGDIGTSPLYTLKTVFDPATGIALSPHTVVGAVSAIFWALMLVVTLKYVTLIMRADNEGEGGIMALLALATRAVSDRPRLRLNLLLLGAFGACLFYGDSVLTPAISVLSAVEGLEIATPAFKPWVMPISLAVLVALFAAQSKGTHVVGRLFGPVMVLWFALLAAIGLWQIAQSPAILAAIDPREAWRFLVERGSGVFLAVGAVVLAMTGAEALYADMGHFGKRPIRLAWNFLVLPALAINYAGQGALMLRDASAASNPFYLSLPGPLLLPMVVLSTAATIIASQAVISGAFSLTQQAIQLGFLPRLKIVHTSFDERGQIYVPAVNWILLAAVVFACLFFQNSSAMASAYGIAVTGTMLITTILTFFVVRRMWGFPLWVSLPSTAFFVAVDSMLLASCSIKFVEGGWFPVALALVALVGMTTWRKGRELLSHAIRAEMLPLPEFVQMMKGQPGLTRVDRTAVFLAAEAGLTPHALMHNLKHNRVLHERNLVVTVRFADTPVVPAAERLTALPLGDGFWQVEARFGFMQAPNLPEALALAGPLGLELDPFQTSYFVSRETVVPRSSQSMSSWRQSIFETLSRNASRAVEFYGMPTNSVIELGTRVQL